MHELTYDFRVEDVWLVGRPASRGDFSRVVQAFASGKRSGQGSSVVRFLLFVRWRLGALLGWDRPSLPNGAPLPTLAERLPPDLRSRPGPAVSGLPFQSLFLLDDEWAAEIVNRTVHGVVHLGWVPDGSDGYRLQIAILVKRKGLLGSLYMAAITPIRHRVVYPRMIREIEANWPALLAVDPGGGPLRREEMGSDEEPQVVAGALMSGDRVLLCHRHPGREWLPNVWDLPGGYVEPGEAPRDALRRELIEELGVDIGEVATSPSWRLVDRANAYRLLIWRVPSWTGSVTNAAPNEHDRLGWFTGADLVGLQLADPRYRPLLSRMLLGGPAPDPCDDDRTTAT